MDTLENIFQIKQEYSYKRKPISYELIFGILEAGYAAYEVENIASTRVIFVETEDTISKIAEISNNQNWIRDAPVVLVMCSDTKLHKKIHTKRDSELFSIQNCSMISQNILLTASEFNLAGAIVNSFDQKKLRSLLSIPDDILVNNIITLGYPKFNTSPAVRKRIIKNVFYEKYSTKARSDKVFPIFENKKLKKLFMNFENKSDKLLFKLIKKFK